MTEILNVSQQKKETNYHRTKFVTENVLAIEMKKKQNKTTKTKKTEMLSNKAVNLGLLIIELSKILMYEFWYDYVKRKYDEKAKSCYMDTGSSLHT